MLKFAGCIDFGLIIYSILERRPRTELVSFGFVVLLDISIKHYCKKKSRKWKVMTIISYIKNKKGEPPNNGRGFLPHSGFFRSSESDNNKLMIKSLR